MSAHTEIKYQRLYDAHPLDAIMRKIIRKNRGAQRQRRTWHLFDRTDPKTWPPAAGDYRIKIKPNYLDFQAYWSGDCNGQGRWMTLVGDGYAKTEDPWGWTFCDEFDQ